MSSPYLNNMIIIGCLLTYTSVILLGLDSHLTSEAALPVICTARIWTLMAGFTLAFGSMFSKTWRVHSIFTDVKLNKKVPSLSLSNRSLYDDDHFFVIHHSIQAIKDYQLFMVVGVLLSIDIVILSTWQIIDPFYLKTKRLDPYVSSQSSKKYGYCLLYSSRMCVIDPPSDDILIWRACEICPKWSRTYPTAPVGDSYQCTLKTRYIFPLIYVYRCIPVRIMWKYSRRMSFA